MYAIQIYYVNLCKQRKCYGCICNAQFKQTFKTYGKHQRAFWHKIRNCKRSHTDKHTSNQMQLYLYQLSRHFNALRSQFMCTRKSHMNLPMSCVHTNDSMFALLLWPPCCWLRIFKSKYTVDRSMCWCVCKNYSGL